MNKTTNITAGILLTIMFALMFFSSWNDAVIFDETAHIGAGYSYLTQRDMRLNPEHPPLVKDLAALPLLLLNLRFPTDTAAWQSLVNGQWDQGGPFLFEFGNNADSILHFARFPIMILGLLLGIVLFLWTRNLYGNKTAILATFFYAFSPTVIAHSRFVTTDIGASLAFLASIIIFIKFLARPTKKYILAAGIVFGVAQLTKFSLFLLIPIFVILGFVWLLVQEEFYDARASRKKRLTLFLKQALSLYLKIALIFIIGAVLIWAFYIWHVWDYPQARQLSDAQTLIGGFHPQIFVELDLWLIGHAPTRPLGQYLLGVMMVTQRTAGGNSAYFLGEVSSAGWRYYFPTVYLLKETLGFHILTLLALFIALGRIKKAREKSLSALRGWIVDNFPIFVSIFFVVFYWTSSIANPLNIGVRHVLPTFPFIFFLVARELALWTSISVIDEIKSFRDFISMIYKNFILPIPKMFFLMLTLLWIASSVLVNFPYYLSYYNELAGGTRSGHLYATDSNYDWGQDLKRLRNIVKEEKIYLDYFGGSTASNGAQRYWLGNQFVPWYSSFGPPPHGALFAVSANSIRGSQAKPVKGFPTAKYEETYSWLPKNFNPPLSDRAGTSIFLFRVP
jgi:4-amino-4-deoxy-L-arabinose transferase-like glycosyltransferase